MGRPILDYSFAGILDGATQRQRGVAYDNVSRNLLENRDLVLVPQQSLTAFVVEKHDVVSHVLLVVHQDQWTALTKGLDNLCRLRTGAAVGLRAPGSVGAAARAVHLP